MTKEKFKELYEWEMNELSFVEKSINKLNFSMEGIVAIHKQVKASFNAYSNSHTFENDNCYYGFVANKVVENWDAFDNVCNQLWNFPRMTKSSLETFYNYIYSAFEMMEEGTFTFKDYLDEQFQTYMTNLSKFFGNKITNDVFHTFAEYLKAKDDWNEDFFKC